MNRYLTVPAGVLLCIGLAGFDATPAAAAARKTVSATTCARLGVDGRASQSLSMFGVRLPPTQACVPRVSRGFPLPDRACSPGAVNPTVTLAVLQDSRFRTGCVRDKAESLGAKDAVYGWYGIPKRQNCEKDHIVPLEIGGADTLDNLWPQCGPGGVKRPRWYFVQKDMVEQYLGAMVRSGQIAQRDAQFGAVNDWTQYLDAAIAWRASAHPAVRTVRHVARPAVRRTPVRHPVVR